MKGSKLLFMISLKIKIDVHNYDLIKNFARIIVNEYICVIN